MNAATSFPNSRQVSVSQSETWQGMNHMSSGDFSGRDEQDFLQSAWNDFLNRNFPSNEAAAEFFGVDESTIRHWKKGRNGLNAKRLVKAARVFPALRQMIFGAA